ncbi:MAG TPA: MerR family DNA-binding transcriptional regulator [Chthoniobacterales bacterium]|nr:MerR family DNA-binding transcriptional regulator [Chthoniobacterales bacterium]
MPTIVVDGEIVFEGRINRASSVLRASQRMSDKLLIGQLTRLAGVKPDSVCFYERNGLLPKPPHAANGYLVFETRERSITEDRQK